MDSREEIRNRMLRHAAKLWGYQESEMDLEAFDPVVSLLIEACATELERIGREIVQADDRILHRVVELLTPDVLTGPLPSHAILHARAISPVFTVKPSNQVLTQLRSDKVTKDIFFSPAGNYFIHDCGIACLAVGNQLLKVNEISKRQLVAQSKPGVVLPANTLWLGIEVAASVTSMEQVAFFFNWRNLPKREYYLHLLADTRWFLGGQELVFRRGIAKIQDRLNSEIIAPFYKDFSITAQLEERIEDIYREHFITIHDFNPVKEDEADVHSCKRPFPQEFEQVFPAEKLVLLKERLLWIRVEFPEYFPSDILSKVECYTNCFPILNRRLIRMNHRLRELLNIIPLQCDEFFLDIESVHNQQEVQYHAIPLTNIRNYRAGQYTLRSRGVGKIAKSDAGRNLLDLIDQLRDESAAFAAFNYDYLNTKVRRLNQELNELEQEMLNKDHAGLYVTYLIIKALNASDTISTEFWSTNGEAGNGVPAGTTLDMYEFTSFRRDSLQLITSTTGGRNQLTPSESGHIFRKALINRERIITREDIRSFCYSELGDQLQRVEIRRGFKIGRLSPHGIERTLEVVLFPNDARISQGKQEFLERAIEFEQLLNRRSASIIPIVVKIEADE